MSPPFADVDHIDKSEYAWRMLKYFSPGDWLCDAVGLAAEDENRQILRMFINTLVLGAIGVAVGLWIAG